MNGDTTNILVVILGIALAASLALLVLPMAQPASYLFVQQAQSGTFAVASGGSGEYILTLEGVWPDTTYFSDRPKRISGTLTIDEFIELDGLFISQDPPNAAVVLNEPASEAEDVIIVELLNPQYDSSTGKLSYTAKYLSDDVPEGLESWLDQRDDSLPDNFSRVTLFVDHNGKHGPN